MTELVTYVLLGCVPALMFHTVPFATRMTESPFLTRSIPDWEFQGSGSYIR